MGNASYTLTGSGRLSAATEELGSGYQGVGSFLQTSGTNVVSGTLSIGDGWDATSGTYSLKGGLLIVSQLVQGPGTAFFNFNGGTLRAGGPTTSSVPMTLGTSGGGAMFDSAGYTMVLSGSLSGTGALTKVGAGTLVLSGSNTYAGGTIVTDGIVEFTAPSALPLGSLLMIGASGDVIFAAGGMAALPASGSRASGIDGA